MISPIEGFSKLTKDEKIDWISENYTQDKNASKALLKKYWSPDTETQKLHDEFIENTITNYYLPFGIAPNFLINDRLYAIPMAIEESSVVAAASKAAKFWLERGGFKTQVLGTEKIGQVHFMFSGDAGKLKSFFEEVKPKLFQSATGDYQKIWKSVVEALPMSPYAISHQKSITTFNCTVHLKHSMPWGLISSTLV